MVFQFAERTWRPANVCRAGRWWRWPERPEGCCYSDLWWSTTSATLSYLSILQVTYIEFKLVFPRDGMSRDKKNFLSRDKGRSKCPGTNSSVPGRPGTKSPLKNQEKDVLKQKIWSFYLKIFNSFCPGTSRDRGFCPGTFAPALVPGQEIFFVLGQRDNGTSHPMETLLQSLWVSSEFDITP